MPSIDRLDALVRTSHGQKLILNFEAHTQRCLTQIEKRSIIQVNIKHFNKEEDSNV